MFSLSIENIVLRKCILIYLNVFTYNSHSPEPGFNTFVFSIAQLGQNAHFTSYFYRSFH